MSEHVNINVDWAVADETGLVDGQGVVEVTAEQHTGREPRSGEAVVTIGSQSKTVSIEQEGKEAFIMFDSESADIGSEAGFITITGKANTPGMGFRRNDPGVTIPSYFSIVTADGETHEHLNATYQMFSGDPGAIAEYAFTITVQVGRNDSSEPKEHVVECFEEGGAVGSIVIMQEAGGGGPEPGEEYIYFQNPNVVCDGDEQVLKLFLESNSNWVISII